jgi:HSP20 family protein
MVSFVSKEKKPPETAETKKAEISVPTKKTSVSIKPHKKPTGIAPSTPSDLWQAFDDTFARFRNDFEDLLFPTDWFETFSFVPEIRVPVVDMEDGEKAYILQAEMPGFKKEDIEIDVQDDAIEITGTAGWKYDKKGRLYICKERACKTFYRRIELPEEIKVDDVAANISEGVLQVTLPKKNPKQKRKVAIK